MPLGGGRRAQKNSEVNKRGRETNGDVAVDQDGSVSTLKAGNISSEEVNNNNGDVDRELQAARRHGVDPTKDKKDLLNEDEDDEDWEDDDEDDEDVDEIDRIPEEIIGSYDVDSDEEAEEDENQGEEGDISKNNNGGGDGNNNTKRVRFVGDNIEENEAVARVYRPDRDQQKDPNVKLTFSNRAYESFFQLRTEYPCLSFNVIRDFDGDARTKYPMSMYLACGTQAPKQSDNQIVLLHVSNLVRTRYDEGSDSDEDEIGMENDEDSDDDEDDDPDAVNNGEAIVNARTISVPHGAINRLRCKEDSPNIIAYWCDDGTVRVADAMDEARALADFDNWTAEKAKNFDKPAPNPHIHCSTRGDHRNEGYGLGWARRGNLGRFASGDCNGHICIWAPQEGGGWANEASWHREALSVEELVWSPTEATVFVAARAGGAVEVWDTRDMRSSRVQFRADPSDINVADWNRAETNSHLLITGADSGIISVWDLRKVAQHGPNVEPLQRLRFHEGNPITSLEFSVHNETVFSATAADGQCTLWDLAVERDIDEEREMVGGLFGRPDISELPDALMFQHQGLYHPKECHFHPQVPGAVVTTDYNGLHIFKPCNWKSLMK